MLKRRNLILTISILFLFSSSVSAQLQNFVGSWTNTNTNTRGVTRVIISSSGNNVYAQAYGQCSPTDCDWGRSPATTYAPNTSSNVVTALTADYNQTAGISTFVLFKLLNRTSLQAQVFTRFTNSGDRRSNYTTTFTFRKAVAIVLGAPVQVSPRNGVVYNRYPRTTTLNWRPVSGASYYMVEIEYYDSGARRWISDYKLERSNNTRYVFSFVGAQPGRWRVWAVSGNGTAGRKSAWRTFSYTR